MPLPEPPVTLPDTGSQALQRLPLHGLTILAVEDSRFACEALRLLCQRSGARLRRAETIAAAVRHLAVYRPDAVIVDLGLPDGDGTDLIRRLAGGSAVVLGTSGDPSGRHASRVAGAAGFIDKPPESLAAFQSAILRHLPGPALPAVTDEEPGLLPDRLALQDDLHRAAALLRDAGDARTRGYVAGFLGSVAQSARDMVLAQAAARAAATAAALPDLSDLIHARLAEAPAIFAPAELGIPLPPPPR